MNQALSILIGQLDSVETIAPGTSQTNETTPSILNELRRERNGFYAYDRALHVFGTTSTSSSFSEGEWNDAGSWRSGYGVLQAGLVFFAEDSFGDQFAWDGRSVLRFVAETGDREEIAKNPIEWLEAIVSDPQGQLGLEYHADCIKKCGRLPDRHHFFPDQPFVLSTPKERRIATIDALENMRFKAHLATELLGVRDGAQVRLVVSEGPKH